MLRRIGLSRFFCDAKKPGPKVDQMIEDEFYSNPYFTTAFPHFKDKVDPQEPKEAAHSWSESLMHRYKPQPWSQEQWYQYAEQTFVEGYRTPRGPLKWMSDEDKEKVHIQIDYEMGKLEDTGLSREEVLYNKPTGVPLGSDPMFQFLKKNRDAREMLIKPGEEFTVEKVLDKALRQDIDVDRSKTLYDKRYQLGEHASAVDKHEPRDYYWEAETHKRRENIVRDVLDELMFPHPQTGRTQKRRKKRLEIDPNEIKWNNLELLSHFVSATGKLKSRYQTRLPGNVQQKVSKAVSRARYLNLFPVKHVMSKFHTEPLAHPLESDPDRMVLNAHTGTIYAKKYETEILYHLEQEDDVPFRTKNEISLKHMYFKPTPEQSEILQAGQIFQQVMKEKGGFVVDSEQTKPNEAYQAIHDNLDRREIDVIEDFLGEKAADPEIFRKQENSASQKISVEEANDELQKYRKQIFDN